jgi:hypothetical protein
VRALTSLKLFHGDAWLPLPSLAREQFTYDVVEGDEAPDPPVEPSPFEALPEQPGIRIRNRAHPAYTIAGEIRHENFMSFLLIRLNGKAMPGCRS